MRADEDFERFYEAEARAVFGVVYALCREPRLAEDATQEAFARALERWDRLSGEPWAAAWVTTTAQNVARRALRRSRVLEGRPAREADVEAAIDLWRTVRVLPRRQQEVVVLYYRLQIPVEEIARLLGMREGTVRTHLARARTALRNALEAGEDGD